MSNVNRSVISDFIMANQQKCAERCANKEWANFYEATSLYCDLNETLTCTGCCVPAAASH